MWDAYYANHQKNEAFRKLKVADIFMGGGTTLVEGSRLGMQMYGNDLNPVAWFVVKNELAQVDPAEVKKLLDRHRGRGQAADHAVLRLRRSPWAQGQVDAHADAAGDGDGLRSAGAHPEQRPEYEYEGPEVIYTFWAKHGPCQSDGCGHRTPIMSSPVMAVKTLTVKAWRTDLFQVRSVRRGGPRSPDGPGVRCLSCSPDEPSTPFAETTGRFDLPALRPWQQSALGNGQKNKKIDLTLLIHPDWLTGAPSKEAKGLPFGGSVTDDAETTTRWNAERAKTLKLIEVRGPLPDEIESPDTKDVSHR